MKNSIKILLLAFALMPANLRPAHAPITIDAETIDAETIAAIEEGNNTAVKLYLAKLKEKRSLVIKTVVYASASIVTVVAGKIGINLVTNSAHRVGIRLITGAAAGTFITKALQSYDKVRRFKIFDVIEEFPLPRESDDRYFLHA